MGFNLLSISATYDQIQYWSISTSECLSKGTNSSLLSRYDSDKETLNMSYTSSAEDEHQLQSEHQQPPLPSLELDTDFDQDSDDEYNIDGMSGQDDYSSDSSGNDIHELPMQVRQPDEVCARINRLIQRGIMSKEQFFYKFIDDVSAQLENPNHEFSKPVIEWGNTVRYLGGSSAYLTVRGPMWAGCGRGGTKMPELAKPNLGGPSLQTLRKHTAGYTYESGVNKFWMISFLRLTKDALPLFDNESVKVTPITLQNDGTALKPSIQYDTQQQLNVGLNPPSTYVYVHQNENPTPQFLRDNVICESNVTCAATMDNAVFMPSAITYKTGTNKSWEDMKDQFIEEITISQTCLHCIEEAVPQRNILSLDSVRQCDSICQVCLDREDVCEECQQYHTSHVPPFRACSMCINLGIKCVRCAVLVVVADCETSNRVAS